MYVPAERLTLEAQLYRDLQARYRNLHISSDFSKLVPSWLQARPLPLGPRFTLRDRSRRAAVLQELDSLQGNACQQRGSLPGGWTRAQIQRGSALTSV